MNYTMKTIMGILLLLCIVIAAVNAGSESSISDGFHSLVKGPVYDPASDRTGSSLLSTPAHQAPVTGEAESYRIQVPTLAVQPVVTSQPVQVSSEYAPDRVIVRYKTDTMSTMSALPSVMSSANAEAGASVVEDFSATGLPGTQVVKVSGSSVTDVVNTYNANPNVLYAEPDYLISLPPDQPVRVAETNQLFGIAATSVPNDPEYSLEWGLKNAGQSPFNGKSGADIKAPQAWSITKGSSSVIIAIVDTGVEYTHPDLAGNIWRNSGEIANNGIDDDKNGYIDDTCGWNFVGKNNKPMDDNGHGTHCAGIIAAVGNNNIGGTGVCWTARIMPLKFLSSTGNGYVSDAISAILYANRMGAHVISNSWGGTQYTQALKDAIDASNAVVACAAGNSGANTDSTPQYPSAYSSNNIIAVAATDCNDKLASFSNYGVSSVDIGAPGVTIRSTYKGGQYKYLSGTSMATPFVSGVAGLVKAANPKMNKAEIKARILSSVDPLSTLSGKVSSGGRLNAAKALGSSTSGTPTPTLTPIPTPTQSGPLTASFLASPVTGTKPLTVQFIDTSVGKPAAWAWNFGDGSVSYQKNPVNTYKKKGVYSVRLTISGGGKMSTIYKSRYIIVK